MDILRLENQLCFPLYALSRQITNLYRPLLEELQLTYPQYLVMLLLWQHKRLSVKEIGNLLLLDSGTLTPLLKRLEKKDLLSRQRDSQDERLVQIEITKTGAAMKKQARNIPLGMIKNLGISAEDGRQLINQLNGILANISTEEEQYSATKS